MATVSNSFNIILFGEDPRLVDTTLPGQITTEDGLQALIDAGLAQFDATQALLDSSTNATNLFDPTYIADRLSQASAEIIATSTALLTIGADSDNGITIGSSGIVAKKATVTTFTIGSDGDATFSGELSAATGSFSGTVTASAIIAGDTTIGSSTGSAMIQATTDVQSDVDSPTYLSTILSNSATSIISTSPNFIRIGTGLGGIFLGTGGLFGRDSLGNDTFSIDATNGDASFAGTVTSSATISGSTPIGTSTGTDIIDDIITAQGDADTAIANVGDNTYLAARLSEAGTSIDVTSSNEFILIGTVNDGIYLGSAGLYGRKGSTTTFSIATDGTANFAGALSAATGSFAGSVTIGATIDGGASIGSSTGTAMISATSTAQSAAETANTNAGIADDKAEAAQSDADDALANVANYSYLESVLENAATNIKTTSTYFLQVGTTATGLYMGSTGLYGKSAGATTFSIDASGNATFAGALSAATGSFAGSVTIGATIDGGASIGSSTGTAMISATSTAQSAAETANTNAGIADGKADDAQSTADSATTAAGVADGKAVAAQGDATSALNNVASYSYLETVLENAATNIKTTSAYFLQVGTTATGLYMGNTGIYGRNAGSTTFSIDASGNATFAGELSAATGSFAGSITVGATIDDSVLIGSESGATMQSNTTTAYNRGTLGYTTALGAVDDASNAQDSADAAQADVDSPTYLSTVLSSSSASIVASSTSFISIEGTGDAGVFIGSGGIVGKDAAGVDTFSIDASDGTAIFSGTLTTLNGASINTTVGGGTALTVTQDNANHNALLAQAAYGGYAILCQGDFSSINCDMNVDGILYVDSVGSSLIPEHSLKTLGNATDPWDKVFSNDVICDTLKVDTNVVSSLIPGNVAWTIGDSSNDWGYVYAERGYFSTSVSSLLLSTTISDTTTTPSHVYVETGSDGYIRPQTWLNFTDKIISEGSNSNGSWVKFENGIMICNIQRVTVASVTCTTSVTSGGYRTGIAYTWTFPVAFSTTTALFTQATTISAGKMQASSASNTVTTTTVDVYAWALNSGTWALDCTIMAIGRWKT